MTFLPRECTVKIASSLFGIILAYFRFKIGGLYIAVDTVSRYFGSKIGSKEPKNRLKNLFGSLPNSVMVSWIYFLVSFLLVGLGQSAWIPEVGLIAAAGGYALFWKAMLQWPKRLFRFFLAMAWFMAVHAVQLSWMTSTHYMGPLILGVYASLLLGLGLQFGLLSSFLDPKKNIFQFQCVAFAGGFVLLEWVRLYFLTGFMWNPAGLALGGNRHSLQLASAIGVYGLSFWIFWTNFTALAFLQKPAWTKVAIWGGLTLFPYGFGYFHEAWVKERFQPERYLRAAVIDTGLTVEEKNRDSQKPLSFIPPLVQWENVWSYLVNKEPVHWIILPEAAFPYGADQPFCPLEICEARWKFYFGNAASADFPPFEPPYAYLYEWKGKEYWMVTNSFFAQTLANHFHADLITGLDYDDGETRRTNAAFLFRPQGGAPERYDKRILVPVGEYVPLRKIQWIADLFFREFGIRESFDAGIEAKVFHSHVPIGVPICLEEIYSGLVRDLRKRGAELLVSLSNDVWFPSSRLAIQHLDHARIRAVENGVFLLRSSNMGWTGGIDCFGQPMDLQPPGTRGAIYLSVPIFSYPTLYSFWGDGLVLFVSALSFFGYLLRYRKSCP